MAVVADEVLALVGNVLGQFGQEVERPKDLEVAGYAAAEVFAGQFGEPLGLDASRRGRRLGRCRNTDQAGEAERAAG